MDLTMGHQGHFSYDYDPLHAEGKHAPGIDFSNVSTPCWAQILDGYSVAMNFPTYYKNDDSTVRSVQ